MRPVKLAVRELAGDCLFQIYPSWEPLAPLRDTLIGSLISVVTQQDVDFAYRKWTRPLVNRLGLSPENCLRKAAKQHGTCYNWPTCQIKGPGCRLQDPAMPWCFEPVGVDDPFVRALAQEILEAWRNSVWVLVANNE